MAPATSPAAATRSRVRRTTRESRDRPALPALRRPLGRRYCVGMPSKRQLTVAAGYVAAAAVYIAVGVWYTDFLLSFWIAPGLPAARRLAPPDRPCGGCLLSWAAHDLEPYAIQRHTRLKIAFVPLLIGSYAPDLMSQVVRVRDPHRRLGPEGVRSGAVPPRLARASASRTRCSSASWSAFLVWKVCWGARLWAISFLIGAVGARDHRHGRHRRDDAALPVDASTSTSAPGPTRGRRDASPTPPRTSAGLGAVWDLVWIVYGILLLARADPLVLRATRLHG